MSFLERPEPRALIPAIVISDNGFIHVGLTPAAPLVQGMRTGKLPSHVTLWDARSVYRSSGANGGLGGLAEHGPREVAGDRWGTRLGESHTSTPRLVTLIDLHQMTTEAWEATVAWKTHRP